MQSEDKSWGNLKGDGSQNGGTLVIDKGKRQDGRQTDCFVFNILIYSINANAACKRLLK